MIAAGERFRAVIMAGGRGERLRPLTDTTPKPLLSVRGRVLIDMLIEGLARGGIRQICVATGYLGSTVRKHLDGLAIPGVEITTFQEPHPLGTAGAIGAIGRGESAPLVVCNADIVTDLDFGAVVSEHARSEGALTVVGVLHEQRLRFGGLEVDGAGRLVAWRERETSRRLVSAGVYVLEPEVAALVSADERLDFPELVERYRSTGGRVQVHVHPGVWHDIGEHTALQQLNGE